VDTGKDGLQFGTNGKVIDNVNIGLGTIFGIDSKANRYIIKDESRIAIVNSNGDIQKIYDIRNGIGKYSRICISCINKNGDIYYIVSNTKGHTVIKIDRDW